MTEDEYAAWKQDFEANQPGQFMKGFKGALVDQNPTLLGNSLKALGVLFDNETIGGLGDSVREWGKSGSEKRAARVPSFSNIRTDSFLTSSAMPPIMQLSALGTVSAQWLPRSARVLLARRSLAAIRLLGFWLALPVRPTFRTSAIFTAS
ncbi:hypothetical protein HED48_23335 [Ochrobactrum intermedium]|nr:hypothetical protein [Brucella intermedia]